MSQMLQDGDRLDVRVFCADQNQISVNQHFYRTTTLAAPGEDFDLARALCIDLAPLYRAFLNHAALFVGVSVTILRPSPGGYARFAPVVSSNGGGAGAAGAAAQPKQVCGLTSWLTNYAGRSFRGRTYWPFVGIFGGADNEAPSSAILDNLIAAAGHSGPVAHWTSPQVDWSGTRILMNKGKTYKGETACVDSRTKDVWATQRKRGDFGQANTSPIVSGTLPFELQLVLQQLRAGEKPRTLSEERRGLESELEPGEFAQRNTRSLTHPS